MDTLIELFDERPLENVLGAEVFRPNRLIFLCPSEVAQNQKAQDSLRCFFKKRNVDADCIFLEASLLYADKVEKQLSGILRQYPEAVIDITGGSDAALFAAGSVAARYDVPVFTYSRKKNRFFNIRNASFIGNGINSAKYDIEDFFLMAGGCIKDGRVNNNVLGRYLDFIPLFFGVFLKHRREWQKAINYFQHISASNSSELSIKAPYHVKGSHGTIIEAPDSVLISLQNAGAIHSLTINSGRNVSFTFKDSQIRTWLRDVGSVLELFAYKECLDSRLFQEVKTSVVVNWDSSMKMNNVQNEIDVIGVSGIMPVFISCKTCDVSTEALNELAIIKERFGGSVAKACIITAMPCRSITRHRAAELGISIIDWEDIKSGNTRTSINKLIMT